MSSILILCPKLPSNCLHVALKLGPMPHSCFLQVGQLFDINSPTNYLLWSKLLVYMDDQFAIYLIVGL